MKTWEFESGHTEARFRTRHMMVSWIDGMFKNISGTLEFDTETGEFQSMETEFDSKSLWTGLEMRDDHLRSADFFDVENHPKITFKSTKITRIGGDQYKVIGDLTIRGITKEVELDTHYMGTWDTDFWVGKENKGPVPRIGIEAKTRINRHDFKVSWQGQMDKGGVVVSDHIDITIGIEGIVPPKD